MLNTKVISVSAGIGFVLSFIFGLFSKSGFGKILLTALIFAVVFAVLSILISFVYSKFLEVEGSAENTKTESEDFIKNNSSVGQNVNIVIADADLEQSGSSNHFNVGDNHQMLNESDISSDVNYNDNIKPDDEIKDNGFVPVRKSENPNNISGKEAVKPENIKQNEAAVHADRELDNSLDTLPDMEGFKVESNTGTGNEENGDGEFISVDDDSFVSSATSYKQSDVNPADIGDTSLMAKAISSILAEESN